MSTVDHHVRRPWIAVLLSLLCTGLGHIYCGRFVKGFVLYSIPFFLLPLVATCALVGVNTLVLLIIAAGYGAVTVVYFYAVGDSAKIARQSDPAYSLRDYNRKLIYVLLVLMQIPFTFAIGIQFRSHVIEAFVCPARSMEPSLQVGDRFLVNKTAYNSRSPQRGEIVVFISPENRKQRWVKRVIAIPGDTIAVHGNEVVLNGQPLSREEIADGSPELHGFAPSGSVFWEENGDRRYRVQLGSGKKPVPDFDETRVPSGMVFVLGDNRGESKDSRFVGFIPQADVLGESQFLYWPARTWARFGSLR